jgi:hypothetical protein
MKAGKGEATIRGRTQTGAGVLYHFDVDRGYGAAPGSVLPTGYVEEGGNTFAYGTPTDGNVSCFSPVTDYYLRFQWCDVCRGPERGQCVCCYHFRGL